jgi:hypothetical protein
MHQGEHILGTESQQLLGHPIMAAVLRAVRKETHCTQLFSNQTITFGCKAKVVMTM